MPIKDPFSRFGSSLTAPITSGFDVMPRDDANLRTLPRALMVATAGDVAVVLKDGSTVTLPALSPGAIYPIRAVCVLATGTTATGIVALL